MTARVLIELSATAMVGCGLPLAEVPIVDPNRGNRSAVHRRMSLLGFRLTESRLDKPLADGSPYRGRPLHDRRLRPQ